MLCLLLVVAVVNWLMYGCCCWLLLVGCTVIVGWLVVVVNWLLYGGCCCWLLSVVCVVCGVGCCWC